MQKIDPPQWSLHSSDQPILFFDGVCVLCSGFANFVLRHDHRQRFRLATAQSAFGQAAYAERGLDTKEFTTNLLVSEGRSYYKSDAFIQTMWLLGGWPSLFVVLKIFPRRLRNWAYDPIARNRYRWFGQKQQCYVARPEDTGRFIR